MARTTYPRQTPVPVRAIGDEVLEDLSVRLMEACPEAVALLRSVRTATPAVQALALGTAPLKLRLALIASEVCEDNRASGGATCELNHLGLALSEHLPPLSPVESEQLTQDVDRLISAT
jgi:hypothetical protein